MRQSRWARAGVRCPFWRGDWDKAVACEGPFDGSGVTLTFRGDKKRKRHMEVFCFRNYEKCEVYRMIQENKYADL